MRKMRIVNTRKKLRKATVAAATATAIALGAAGPASGHVDTDVTKALHKASVNQNVMVAATQKKAATKKKAGPKKKAAPKKKTT